MADCPTVLVRAACGSTQMEFRNRQPNEGGERSEANSRERAARATERSL